MSIDNPETEAPPQPTPVSPPSFEEVVVKSAMPVIQRAVANTVQSVIDDATADVSEKIDANHAASLASIKSVDINSAERDDSLAGRISTLEDSVFAAAGKVVAQPWFWYGAFALASVVLLTWEVFFFAGSARAASFWEVAVAALGGGAGILAKVTHSAPAAKGPPPA